MSACCCWCVAQDGGAGPDSQFLLNASTNDLHSVSRLQLPEGTPIQMTLLQRDA